MANKDEDVAAGEDPIAYSIGVNGGAVSHCLSLSLSLSPFAAAAAVARHGGLRKKEGIPLIRESLMPN